MTYSLRFTILPRLIDLVFSANLEGMGIAEHPREVRDVGKDTARCWDH